MDEFLQALKLNDYEYNMDKNGSAVIDLKNSNDYVRVFDKLDRSEFVEEDPESSQITLDASSVQFTSDGYPYRLTLMADFKGDVYKLIITED